MPENQPEPIRRKRIMMTIPSSAIPNTVWKIKRIMDGAAPSAAEMEAESEFIRNLNPAILCNDLTGKCFCMDIKMPTGRYLENITPAWNADAPDVFTAAIIYY